MGIDMIGNLYPMSECESEFPRGSPITASYPIPKNSKLIPNT